MKLLMIDDDRRLCDAVRRRLEADGVVVELAHDGVEGLWKVETSRYDVILLDLMLPLRNGFQVCADIRARGDRTPILMLTAKDGHLDEAEGLDTGADDYLTKPFAHEVLTARIRALMRRSPVGGLPVIVIDDLRVDPSARRVERGGTPIELTAREFDLLWHLARAAGAVVSKRDILAGVWEDDFYGDPNIVEVYVRRLRRKIDEPFASSLLRTVRGAGYVLDGDDPR
ncbi:MAG: response regulator transcription factor [Microthrixaceae bacterium]|nr:response regulator transcription factor [Microthrixaceae bacterium]